MASGTECWWVYGNYTGEDCPNCGRNRIVECEDPKKKTQHVCEKCHWHVEANDYLDADWN